MTNSSNWCAPFFCSLTVHSDGHAQNRDNYCRWCWLSFFFLMRLKKEKSEVDAALYEKGKCFFFLPLSGLRHLCFCLSFWLMQMGISFCKSVPCYCPLFFSMLHNFLPLHSRREGWQHELPCCSLCFFFSPFLLARFNAGSVSIDSPFFLGISTTFSSWSFPCCSAAILQGIHHDKNYWVVSFFLFWS